MQRVCLAPLGAPEQLALLDRLATPVRKATVVRQALPDPKDHKVQQDRPAAMECQDLLGHQDRKAHPVM